jgi:hypothetical protein
MSRPGGRLQVADLCKVDPNHLGVGNIPEQMSWMVIILLPKGGGNFQGIGLLDPYWKVVEKIMVC